jgi:hypothetical protein
MDPLVQTADSERATIGHYDIGATPDATGTPHRGLPPRAAVAALQPGMATGQWYRRTLLCRRNALWLQMGGRLEKTWPEIGYDASFRMVDPAALSGCMIFPDKPAGPRSGAAFRSSVCRTILLERPNFRTGGICNSLDSLAALNTLLTCC